MQPSRHPADDGRAPPARAYLDHNASSPMRPEALAALTAAAVAVGNPSSVHGEGRAARARLDAAREAIAGLFGAGGWTVAFGSGGTEANAAALRPGALLTPDGRPVARLVTSATEHPSVLGGHGFDPAAVEIVPVDGEGRLDLDALDAALVRGDGVPTLVSIGAANGETGVLQPLAAGARLARFHGAAVHTDAVQAAGRTPLALGEVDAVSVSAHKIGGPMGVGALLLAPGRVGPAMLRRDGGGQERGLRAGSENVPGIAAFGAAAEAVGRASGPEAGRLAALRDEAEASVRAAVPDTVVFGSAAERIPNTLLFSVPGLEAATALMALDLGGVAVSSGSACASGKVGRSHVLAAMGVPPAVAAGAIRLSFGWSSARRDVLRFAEVFESLVGRLYERRRARAA